MVDKGNRAGRCDLALATVLALAISPGCLDYGHAVDPNTLQIQIVTFALPRGTVDVPYLGSLEAVGGSPPYAWRLTQGSLAPGLVLDSATGTILGTPTAFGDVSFTVQVRDSAGLTDAKPLTFPVDEVPQFIPGATIPGYVLRPPTGGRADIRASGSFAVGTWTVMFTRALTNPCPTDDRQFDGLATGSVYPFGIAVLDDARGTLDTMSIQDTTVYSLGNETSAAAVKAKSTKTAPAADPNDPAWGAEFTTAGGSASMASPVTLRAAYDTSSLYLLAIWADSSSTESDQKEYWLYDGTTWTHQAPDPFGVGYDEDHLAIWWNIDVSGFETQGCQALCHQDRMGTDTLGQKADLWHWQAGLTNPLGFADDERLQDGEFAGHLMAGRTGDAGTITGEANVDGTGAFPVLMADTDPAESARFLIAGVPGSKRAVAFNAAGFRSGATIPGHVLHAPSESRADIRASGKYSGGIWKVMFARALATSYPTDDRQFDGLATGAVYEFSVAVLDDAKGTPDTMGIQDTTVYRLGNETSKADVKAKSIPAAPTADPNDPAWGVAFTTTGGSAVASPVTLRAAYDATNLYLLAIWSDASLTESDQKEHWLYDGTTWTRTSPDSSGVGNDEDHLAIWWNIDVSGFSEQGCRALCHPNRMGTDVLGQKADLWHWHAGLTNPLSLADDERLADGVFDGHLMAGRTGDAGTGIDEANVDRTGTLPTFMSETQPFVGAQFLLSLPPRAKRAVPFRH